MDLSAEFATLIQAAADGSLPRPAIEDAMTSALAAPALVALRGEPGSGKTCLLARAVRAGGGLHHFLRRGHTESSLWTDPHAFLLSIGFQLKAAYGADLFAGSVAIDVDQVVHELDEGARLIGVRVERLVASPWAPVNLHVRQQVGRAGGDVAAVTIAEMVDDVHKIPLRVFREMALLAPLRRLRRREPATRVLMWIDALDEEGDVDAGIAALVPLPQELESLGNLGIVLASRPSAPLQRFVDAGARLVDLADAGFDADRREFVQAFVAREAADPAVRAALSAAGTDAAGLAAKLGSDNPMVLAQGYAAVRRGELSALLAGGVPQGLDAIHARLADSLARRPDFAASLAPVLQVLAVARRAMSVDELARYAALDRAAARRGIDALSPFLERHADGHALYHRTFQETLVDPAHRDRPWAVTPADANDRIAAAYWPVSGEPPSGLDDYGLAFLATHLAAGGEASRARLLELPDRAWQLRRREAAGSLWPVLDDLQLAMQVAQSRPPSEALPVAARLALIAGRIHDVERDLPVTLAGATVRAGHVQRALDSVSPQMRIADQVSRQTAIVAALLGQAARGDEPMPVLASQLLRQALALVARDPDGWSIAELLEACPRQAAGAMADWIQEAGELVRRLPADWRRPRALIAVARLQAGLDAEQGGAWFRTALVDCERLRSSRTLEEGRLARAWLGIDPSVASNLLGQLHFQHDANSVETVLHIGRVMMGQGMDGALADLAAQSRDLLAAYENPYERGLGEAELCRAWVDAGDLEAAHRALERADEAHRLIGGESDPDRVLQNRPQMAADVVMATAAAAVRLGAPDAAQRLERAWTTYTRTGFHNAHVAELARLQREVEPALLEVYVAQIPDVARRVDARLAALPELFDSEDAGDHALALRWYAQALLDAERDAEPAGAAGYLLLEALMQAPAPCIDAAWARASVSLRPEDAVAVHLAQWPRIESARAADWLAETVRLWAAGCESVHEVFEVPGRLAALQAPLAHELLARPVPTAPPPRAALLELALGALAERLEPGSGRPRFDTALAHLDEAHDDEVPAAALRAFAAGAWSSIDSRRAQSLWRTALLWLNRREAFATDTMHRHTWLMILARALEAADPDAALSVYLANPQPAPEPGTISFTVPGPRVAALLQTGMTHRDYRLGLALARAGLATDDLQPGALQALALVASTSESPASRLRQLQAAFAAAGDVEPASLRALLQAKAVRALAAMGAQRAAAEKSHCVLRSVRQALPVFGTMPLAGYAAALGELAAAALVRGEADQAASLVFEARLMGAEGVDRALASLCEPLFALDANSWINLLEESDRAMAG